jgi:hypothetical protein
MRRIMDNEETTTNIEEVVKTSEQLELERITEQRDRYLTQHRTLVTKVATAKDLLITAVRENELEADADFVEKMAELFDWTLTRDVDVSVDVTIKGTLTIPLGKDLSDFDATGFELDLSLDRYTNSGAWDWEQNDYDIDDIND